VIKSVGNAITIKDPKEAHKTRTISLAHVKQFRIRSVKLKHALETPEQHSDTPATTPTDAPNPNPPDPLKLHVIEKILNHRKVRHTFEYRVQWEGTNGETSWIPRNNFVETDLLKDYWEGLIGLLSIKEIPPEFRPQKRREERPDKRSKRQRKH
jgi:hypothetical protein